MWGKAEYGMLHGQQASSTHGHCVVPLAQHLLQAQALLDLGSCASLAAAALVWPMCLLHQPSMPPNRATSTGCLFLLPLLPCPQHSWWLHWQGPHSQHTSLVLPCLHPASLTHTLGSSTRNGCKHPCWRCVPRQWHPRQGGGTELSPGPRWQGARLSLLYRPSSAPGSTVTSLCFF